MKVEKLYHHILALVLATLCVVLFQNCAEDFDPSQYGGSTSSSSTSDGNLGEDSSTTPTPTPAAPAAPKITSKSPTTNVDYLENFTLTVIATGDNLEYQWYKDDSILTGKTSNTLSVNDARVSDSGIYSLVVANSAGSVQADITVNVSQEELPQAPPVITSGLKSQSVKYLNGWQPGEVVLSVSATNATSYKWFFRKSSSSNYELISGATGPSLTRVFTGKNSFEVFAYWGQYQVTVSNDYGQVTSTAVISFDN